MRNVRLKREEGEKKVGIWRWRDNPFVGTRELDGLRVMMAVINNWDLKDENNAIRDEEAQGRTATSAMYEVSDLGASFGTTGRGLSHTKSKGNLRSYTPGPSSSRKSGPISSISTCRAGRPCWLCLTPHEFFSRMGLRWIGRDIPRQNARWMGDLLGELSPRSDSRRVSVGRI